MRAVMREERLRRGARSARERVTRREGGRKGSDWGRKGAGGDGGEAPPRRPFCAKRTKGRATRGGGRRKGSDRGRKIEGKSSGGKDRGEEREE